MWLLRYGNMQHETGPVHTGCIYSYYCNLVIFVYLCFFFKLKAASTLIIQWFNAPPGEGDVMILTADAGFGQCCKEYTKVILE